MASVNKNIALVPLPQSDAAGANNKALWLKPGMYFSVAERSTLKNEAAEFINWFVNSNEANDVILAERGTPVSSKVREHLNSTGILSEQQLEMFKYVDAVTSLCGDAPAPDPVGISEVDAQFKLTAYSALYGQSTPEKAAATFRKNANEILARSN
jgi:multiple sugar transport system substrate-binding protein